MDRIFSVEEVARRSKVAPSTVRKWLKSNRLRGYRSPGSWVWKVPEDYLVEFFIIHRMSLGDLVYSDRVPVLVVSPDVRCIQNLREAIPGEQRFRFMRALNRLEAEIALEDSTPVAIIVDFALGQDEAEELCRNAKERSKPILVVALRSEGATLSTADCSFGDVTFEIRMV